MKLKFLQENFGSKVFGTGFTMFFFLGGGETVSFNKGNKSKNKQMELYQTAKLLHSRGNASTKWEGHLLNVKRFANIISDKGLISKELI